jgi:single-strand DNA-binding protein
MAGTVNKVILIGRLGADPELRYSSDGAPVLTFNLATDEPVKTADGNWDRRAEWHRIVCFGKTAESVSAYLNKGKQVYIEGKLRTRQWEDQQGVKRYTTEIMARDITLLGSAGDQSHQGPSERSYSKREGSTTDINQQMNELPPIGNNSPDDEIPF